MDNFGNMTIYVFRSGTGIDADAFKQAVMHHGGSQQEMSQLVKSEQHVLADASRRTPGKNHNHVIRFLKTLRETSQIQEVLRKTSQRIRFLARTPPGRAARLGAARQIQEKTPQREEGSVQGLRDGHVGSHAYLGVHGRRLIATRASANLTLGSCQVHELKSFVWKAIRRCCSDATPVS